MIGAIAGDIIGSIYEHHPIKTKHFPLFDGQCRFTDDTVLTVAIADAILSNRSYLASVRKIGQRHPNAGCGASFIRWLYADRFSNCCIRQFGYTEKPDMLEDCHKQPARKKQTNPSGKHLWLDSSKHIRYKTASCCFTRTRRAYMEEQDEDGAGKKSLFRYDGQSRYPCERRQAL